MPVHGVDEKGKGAVNVCQARVGNHIQLLGSKYGVGGRWFVGRGEEGKKQVPVWEKLIDGLSRSTMVSCMLGFVIYSPVT